MQSLRDANNEYLGELVTRTTPTPPMMNGESKEQLMKAFEIGAYLGMQPPFLCVPHSLRRLILYKDLYLVILCYISTI